MGNPPDPHPPLVKTIGAAIPGRSPGANPGRSAKIAPAAGVVLEILPCESARRRRGRRAMLDFLKTAFVTMLVTLDPPGLAPVFIGLTLGMTKTAQREVALRGSVIAFLILAAFAFGGGAVMNALGISFPAFRIAGGLLLFYIAFEMIFELRGERKQAAAARDQIRNVAAFPLAIPLMSGPGSITATMLLAGRAGSDWLALSGLMAIIAGVTVLCYLTFLMSERVSRLLGTTGSVVLSRLLGVVLAALAVQFVITGVLTVGK